MTDFGMPMLGLILGGLIAAVLYTATYLSFVRLLRFPRNWLSTSRSEILVTVLLAALTVAHVAWSTDGLDLVSLVISICFVAVLFVIVAAPAVAFRPASQVMEFLARHADYANLWLLAPALAAGLAVPNIKLQAMLATAMAIELLWFVRQRQARAGRQLYPLDAPDLSVLKTQSEDDLKAFRARQGIHELELSGDGVGWRGCGKTTPPCPFNYYVNRLGLNTAPCCREHMRDLCHDAAACLDEIGAVYWLEGGSLLGAVREDGGLLAWEDDVDISVLLEGDMTWGRLAAALTKFGAREGYYVDLFEKGGLVSVSFDQPKPWPFRWERNRMRGEIRLDLAIYHRAVSAGKAVLERQSKKAAMPTTENGGYGVPEEIVLPTARIDYLGRQISCPNNSDSYLRVLYGDYERVEYTYLDAAAAENRRLTDAA